MNIRLNKAMRLYGSGLVGCALFVAIAALAGPARGDDWPQYRGINRDGVSAETGWLLQWPPTNEVWRQTIGYGFSSMAVSDGRVYTMGWAPNLDTVYCFGAYDGGLIWSYSYVNGPLKGHGPESTPLVDGNYVYTLSHTGNLYCFNKVTGAVVWNVNFPDNWHSEWGDAGSPLVDGNLLIVPSGGGCALDKNNGTNIWSLGGTSSFSSPKVCTYNGQRIVLMVALSGNQGLAEATGTPLSGWGFGAFYGEEPEFCYTNEFYCDNTLYQMTGSGLTAVWSGGMGNNNSYSARLVYGDYVYGLIENAGTLNCISLANGQLKWSQSLNGYGGGIGALMASDGKVVLLTDSSHLIILNAGPTYDTGGRGPYQMTWETYLGNSQSGPRGCPVLANGLLYLRDTGSYNDTDGKANLVCLNLGAGSHGGPGVLQLSSAAFSVGQMAGSATITLTRTNGISGAVTVKYATANGTAVAGTDYIMTTGTLTFAANQASQSFTVPILNSGQAGADKTVNLSLSNPTGGATLGSPINAVLTIVNDNGAYRMKLGFTYNRPETLTNFPALVVLSTNLSGFSYSQFASPNGYDLRFSTSDNSQELNYQVEQWNTNGNSYVWVQVPQLQSGTYIWASWDNPAYGITSAPAVYTTNGAMWPTASYAGVWHMNQANAQDSTVNKNNGANVVGTITNAVGLVDGAAGVANGYVHVNDSVSLDSISVAMTVSCWVRFSQLPNSEQDFIRKESHVSMGVADNDFTKMRTALTTSSPNGWTGANDDSFNPPLSVGPWYFIAFSYNGAAGQLWNFENGMPIGGSPHSIGAAISPNANFLGLAGIDSHSLLGAVVDEIRVEPVFRSTNWMWASYLTVVSNMSFSGYGSVQSGGGSGTNYTINAVAGPNGNINPMGYVVVALGGSQTFTITPNTSCNITNVFVDGSSVGVTNSYAFSSVHTNHTISAFFSASSVTNYTITASAGANGSITPSGAVSVPAGSNQTFSIAGNSGYKVTNVVVDGSSVGATNSYSFNNVLAGHTISASFGSSATNYVITAAAGPNGSITPQGLLFVPAGSNQTFTIAVNAGYSITNVLVDGTSVGTSNSYTFNNVQTNHAISAWFGGSGTTGFVGWADSMTVSFSGYNRPETLTNFPVLVVLSTGMPGFSYSQFASPNGYDLRFSASDGVAVLNYEIEQWDPGGTSYVWVQVPQLSIGSYIWAYWGNPGAASGPAAYTINGAVWPTNAFAAVWHMGQTNALDSTANTNNGTAAGDVTSASGIIGGAQAVYGGGRVIIPNSSSISFTTNVATYSGWVNFNTVQVGEQVIMREEQSRELGFSDSTHVRDILKTGGTSGWTDKNDDPINPVASQWYYLAFTYDGSVIRNFWNGVPLNAGHTVTGNISWDPYTLCIGAYAGNNDAGPVSLAMDAIIDEVRIEHVFRSTNWIWATYMTVASNAGFTVYGAVQGGGVGGIPPGSWIQQYYPGTPSNNYASVASGDTDGDGMTAWQEYLAGTDPTVRNSVLNVAIVQSNGNILVTYPAITVIGNTNYSGVSRYYGLESATDLINAIWQPVNGTNICNASSIIMFTNSTPGRMTFYRVRARLQ